jgi:hypothetical protein
MMNQQVTIEFLIKKEREIINKYKEFTNVTRNQEQMLLCDDLSSKHNLHIEVLEKYLER